MFDRGKNIFYIIDSHSNLEKEEQMNRLSDNAVFNRRDVLKMIAGGAFVSSFTPNALLDILGPKKSKLFWIKKIPHQPFYHLDQPNYHAGIDCLLHLMGKKGLKFFRSDKKTTLSSPKGLIDPEDVVLVKVNAQWKYRGCTNSDLIRGLVQRILDHPDVFTGEVVIFENGQGRGSLNCDTSSNYSNSEVHANALDESHSFTYLVESIFQDSRVTAYLLDPIRSRFIDEDDHETDGYRRYENVSYPCFTTGGGHKIELQKGLWTGDGFAQNLKLINVPVLKHHDTGGSEITASLKHVYGIVSMADGQSSFRHYQGLGETCGKMMASVCTPVLNIMDAIWVSHRSLAGHPTSAPFQAQQIVASQDPVALDYWSAKKIIYPIDKNDRHHPDFPGIQKWLAEAEETINSRGGLFDRQKGIFIRKVTKDEDKMEASTANAKRFVRRYLRQA